LQKFIYYIFVVITQKPIAFKECPLNRFFGNAFGIGAKLLLLFRVYDTLPNNFFVFTVGMPVSARHIATAEATFQHVSFVFILVNFSLLSFRPLLFLTAFLRFFNDFSFLFSLYSDMNATKK